MKPSLSHGISRGSRSGCSVLLSERRRTLTSVLAIGAVLGLFSSSPVLVSATVPGSNRQASAIKVASSTPVEQAQARRRTYTFVDLGSLADPPSAHTSAAWGINRSGQIVGASETEVFGAAHAFLWQDGQIMDLGAIGGGTFAASAAYGLNNRGHIVGQTTVSFTEPPHAFLYRNGVMNDLGRGFGRGSFSRAWAINQNGQIVGERSRTQSAAVRAFLYQSGSFLDLGTLGGHNPFPFGIDSIAYAINDRGQIVGTALPPEPPLHAFLWEEGVMQDLGTLGGNTEATQAFGINNSGAIVGVSQTLSEEMHAFLWRDGVMQDLGTLGGDSSYAYAINRAGQIVGGSRTPTSPEFNAGHAFIWQRGRMIDLNEVVTNLPADVVLEVARAINDDGRIVGTTCTQFCEPGATATYHGYLLIPNPD
jgi:probable HAF family extracellular repeat protein